MTRVKHVFGVLIIGFAGWYAWLGYSLATADRHAGVKSESSLAANIEELSQAFQKSRTTHQPVIVDFWASWCKNCSAMEHSTLRDPAVKQQLKDYHFVRFQAEHLNDPALKPLLDEFGVMGLPTLLVLVPTASDHDRQTLKSEDTRSL